MKSDRDISKLNPEFRLKVQSFLDNTRIKQLWVFVTEALRTRERQEWLYASWRSRPWPIVTWTLESNHITWIAIDIAFNWPELYPSDVNVWKEVYRIARQYWIKSLYDTYGVDKPHLENTRSAPSKEYINQKIMDDIKPKALEACINNNSILWNLFRYDTELQKALEDMNKLLRSRREEKS